MVRNRRYIAFYADQPHVQYEWCKAFKRMDLAPTITGHAPWMNTDAISYAKVREPNREFFW